MQMRERVMCWTGWRAVESTAIRDEQSVSLREKSCRIWRAIRSVDCRVESVKFASGFSFRIFMAFISMHISIHLLCRLESCCSGRATNLIENLGGDLCFWNIVCLQLLWLCWCFLSFSTLAFFLLLEFVYVATQRLRVKYFSLHINFTFQPGWVEA